MKRNNFWSIIALCAVACVGTNSAMEKSQSWYDWAASGVNSGVNTAKILYYGPLVTPSNSTPQENQTLQPNQILSNGTILAPWKSPQEEKEQLAQQEKKLIEQKIGNVVVEEKLKNKLESVAEEKEVKQATQGQSKEAVENKQIQEKNAQNIELSESNIKNGVCESGKYTFTKSESFGAIYQNGNNLAYSIDNTYQDKMMPFGIYYRTPQGVKPIPVEFFKSKDGKEIVKNQLGNLSLSDHVLEKMNNERDQYHNFPVCLEKNFGEWASVVIEGSISSTDQLMSTHKEFTLKICIPGSIRKKPGFFEFIVVKNLYKERGLCTHRLFRENGICGARGFGSEKNSYTNKKNNTSYRQANK